tara:strand:+ start:370 stop:507 length:138 start_codon:yes stop_codon:yes gene_type:complete
VVKMSDRKVTDIVDGILIERLAYSVKTEECEFQAWTHERLSDAAA